MRTVGTNGGHGGTSGAAVPAAPLSPFLLPASSVCFRLSAFNVGLGSAAAWHVIVEATTATGAYPAFRVIGTAAKPPLHFPISDS